MAKFTISQLDAKPDDYSFAATDLVFATIGTATPFVSSVKVSLQQLDEALSETTGDWVRKADDALYYTAGNVGVGTNSPASKLVVRTPLSENVFIDVDAGIDDFAAGVRLQSIGNNKWSILNDANDSDKLSIRCEDSSSKKYLTLDTSGNVGIGTIAPTSKLSVMGGISATGGLSAVGITSFDTGDVKIGDDLTISTTNNSSITDTPFMRSNGSELRINSRNSSVSGVLYLNHDSPGNVIMATGWSGTKVGIGTTSPSETLTVAGNVSASGYAYTKDVKNVMAYGAKGNGTTDDATSILAAFNAVRDAGGGVVEFPYATYMISHGFRIPDNCVVKLNGSTLRATTTFGQGVDNTELSKNFGTIHAFFQSASSIYGPLPADIGNWSVIGDGAILDGNRQNQTGSPGGYMGFNIEPTDVPYYPGGTSPDWNRVKNLLIQDLTITRAGYDGFSTSGAQNVLVHNVKVEYAKRIGFVCIGGENVTFDNCQANYTIGENLHHYNTYGYMGPENSGAGYWNEPNLHFQHMVNLKYINCSAKYNYQDGFLVYNGGGGDPNFHVEVDNCHSLSNVWNAFSSPASAEDAPGFGNFTVSTRNPTSAACTYIFKNCVSEETLGGSGFLINKGIGTPAGTPQTDTVAGDAVSPYQRIILDNCTCINNNRADLDGPNRTPIRIGAPDNSVADPLMIIRNPVIVAPVANTAGYGISIEGRTDNFHLDNPTFVGNFTLKTYTSETTGRWHHNRLDPFVTRLGAFDQTSEPTSDTAEGQLFPSELAVWQDDNNQFTGIYKRDDSDTPKYVNFNNKKRIRSSVAYSSESIAAGDHSTGTHAIVGAALGDHVVATHTANLADGGGGIMLTAHVNAADSIRWCIHNAHTSSARTIPAGNLIFNVYGVDY